MMTTPFSKAERDLDTREQDTESYAAQLEQEAENRRKLLATLEPGARKYAIKCFAQLGLYQ